MFNFFHETYRTIVNVGFSKLLDMTNRKTPLIFEIFTECQTTKARIGRMTLVHHHVDTPVFMPVGTQVYETPFSFCNIYLSYYFIYELTQLLSACKILKINLQFKLK